MIDVNKVTNILNKLKDNFEKYEVRVYSNSSTYYRVVFKLNDNTHCFIYNEGVYCGDEEIGHYSINDKYASHIEIDLKNNLPLKIVLMELKQMYDYYVENLFMESYSKIMNETDF